MDQLIELCKVFRFEASHVLVPYVGKCARLHGHSYKLEVVIQANLIDAAESGVVVDFDVLKKAVTECVIDKYDHRHLNDFFVRPTAEFIVFGIAKDLKAWFYNNIPSKVSVQRVRLWETSTCWAQWSVL